MSGPARRWAARRASGGRLGRTGAARPERLAQRRELLAQCRELAFDRRRDLGFDGRLVERLGLRHQDAGEDAGEGADDADARDHDVRRRRPPSHRDRVVVAIAHRRDGHDRPPQGVPAGLDVGVRRVALELDDEQAGRDEHDERRQRVMNRAYCPRFVEDVLDEGLLVLAAQDAA